MLSSVEAPLPVTPQMVLATSMLVRDHDKLRALARKHLQKVGKAADIGLVKRRVYLVQNRQRQPPAF